MRSNALPPTCRESTSPRFAPRFPVSCAFSWSRSNSASLRAISRFAAPLLRLHDACVKGEVVLGVQSVLDQRIDVVDVVVADKAPACLPGQQLLLQLCPLLSIESCEVP